MAYEQVNGQWPAGELPPLTAGEAVTAAKRLYRFAMKRSFRGKVKVTSGRRDTWIRSGVLSVNPEKGWHDLVHMLSHYCAFRLHPKAKPHSPQHAWIERTMIEYAVKSGWLGGKLKRPEKTKPDPRLVRAQRARANLKRWESKRRRADTAIRKLKKTVAYYERAQSESARAGA